MSVLLILKKHLFRFSFVVLLIVLACNSNKKSYDAASLETEIGQLVHQLVALDSIAVFYPNYRIHPVLINYVPREKKEIFVPGPSPDSSLLFPAIIKQCEESKDIRLSEADIAYIKTQEYESKKLILSDAILGERKLTTKERAKYPYVYFSLPIFNTGATVAWVRMGLYCGGECAEEKELLVQKQGSKWHIVSERVLMVS